VAFELLLFLSFKKMLSTVFRRCVPIAAKISLNLKSY